MKTKLILIAAAAMMLGMAACSKKPAEKPGDNATIVKVADHKFSASNDEAYASARFYSTSLGKAFKVADVTDANAPKIDLGLKTMGQTMGFFVSPDHKDNGIKKTGATKTEYMLDLKAEKITTAQFDEITKTEDFAKYTFTPNNESFPLNDAPVPFFCFFKNAAGKIGVMRITKVSAIGGDPGVTVDIKVQK